MSIRSLLFAAVFGSILLTAGIGAAASDDGQVTVSETNETVLIGVEPCDGYLCELSNEPFDLYINGEEEISLGYNDQYRARESQFTNGSVEIAVAKPGFFGDFGWAFEVERHSPNDRSTGESNNAGNSNQSNHGNSSKEYGSPPEVVVDSTPLSEFGECMGASNWSHAFSEAEYCYGVQFD